MFRLKTIFSDRVRARSFGGQSGAGVVRCATLNSADAAGDAGQLRGVSRTVRGVEFVISDLCNKAVFSCQLQQSAVSGSF